MIRIAEHLRHSGDHYHHIYRDPAEPDAVLLPLGPQLQELGERLILALRQSDLSNRTAVWLTLPARPAIAELVDPAIYDPDATGEPEALVAEIDARWAMATEWARIGPSTVYHVILWVPRTSGLGWRESRADYHERPWLLRAAMVSRDWNKNTRKWNRAPVLPHFRHTRTRDQRL